jgi:hypothetical protein
MRSRQSIDIGDHQMVFSLTAQQAASLAKGSISVAVQTALLEVAATYDDLALQAERLARLGYK